ncbi:hypothetical protein GCM10010103_73260 [Streptomyces paradoxus]
MLRLEAAQACDGVEDREVGAVEEQLPGEGGAVERPGVENGHRCTSAFASCADPWSKGVRAACALTVAGDAVRS